MTITIDSKKLIGHGYIDKIEGSVPEWGRYMIE